MRSVWITIVLAAGLLGGAGAARASEPETVAALDAEVAGLERGRAAVEQRQAQLEAEARVEVREIERLKALPPGVARDYRLGQLLSASQARAEQLDALTADLRARDGVLFTRRRSLVEECGRELAQAGLVEARRAELVRVRAAASAKLARMGAAGEPIGIARPGSIDPLAGPSELAERADRLQDDEEKLHREQDRLDRRIGSLEERKRVRERAADVEDDLFGEWTVGRRAVRVATTPATGTERTSASPAAAGAPSPGTGAADNAAAKAQTPGSGALGGGGGGGTTSFDSTEAAPATVLRGLVDPATLADLRRSEGGGDPELELGALKKARGDIAKLAAELRRRESELRRRAADLKKNK